MKLPYTDVEYFNYYKNWISEQLLSYFVNIPKNKSKKEDMAHKLLERISQSEEIPIQQVDTYNSMEELGESNFLLNYVIPGKPVVIKGMAKDWPCVKNWSLDYFSEKFGDEKLPFLESQTGEYNYVEYPLRDICKEIEDGSRKYAKFSNLILKYPELINDFDRDFMNSTCAVRNLESSIQLFIGGAGTTTNIHTAISNVSFVQVHGNKKWLTLPKEWTPVLNPVVDTQPQFMASEFFNNLNSDENKHITKKLPFIEVNLEAGDFFFNPAWTWHAVENTSTSIGVAFRWVPLRAAIQSPILTTMVILKQLGYVFNMKNHTKGQYFPEKWP